MCELVEALGLKKYREELLMAALHHDWGKAHPVFQATVNPEGGGDLLAKSVTRGKHKRKRFRHELASALALLQSGAADLSVYLAAAHHGKVRLSIRALPDEDKPEIQGLKFARGIYDGDTLGEIQLGDVVNPALRLDLEPMLLGQSVAGEPSWMERMLGLRDEIGVFRLAYLEALIREVQPDLLHLTQYCFGNLEVSIPRIVVAHGDLLSWWVAVHGHEPRETQWMRWYRSMVADGIRGASMIVSPSMYMLDTLRLCYAKPASSTVIYNGRNPLLFNPYTSKDDSVLSVGKLWDAGKQVSLLTQHSHPLPVCIVAADQPVDVMRFPLRADVKLKTEDYDVAFRGPQTEAQLRQLYSKASIYVATSRYEPFGMAPLEAALSRCAIVANDIPVFREIWGDAAVYFRTNDSANLADALRRLSEDRDFCRAHGNLAYQRARTRFPARRMLDEYLDLYRRLLLNRRAAA
jgi:glycosyltransferase involved in cell wall biosynthesis